jgi:OmpA-OmpF porin, OOP family
MGINILDNIKGELNGDLIKKIASFLDEDATVTQKALDVALPTVLSGVANQATNSSDASNLLNTLIKGGHDGSIFSSLGILLGGGSATQGVLNMGNSITNNLFGDKISGIIDWISSSIGIKAGSAKSLLSIAAPLIMNVIGKKVLGENTGVNGLMTLLGSQTEILRNILPAGLKSKLGLSNLNLNAPSVVKHIEGTTDKSLLTRLLPWLILLIAALLGLNYLKTCNTESPEPRQAVVTAELPAIKVDTVKSIKLPEGDLNVKTGSFLDQLNSVITSATLDSTKALTFENINFAKSSSELTEDSKLMLADLVKIMKAYPNVTIKINGHTDSRGDEDKNKKLSSDRAESVKNYLKLNGISSERVTTEGYGSSKPILDNSTEEGRAKNRRIEVYVLKK